MRLTVRWKGTGHTVRLTNLGQSDKVCHTVQTYCRFEDVRVDQSGKDEVSGNEFVGSVLLVLALARGRNC